MSNTLADWEVMVRGVQEERRAPDLYYTVDEYLPGRWLARVRVRHGGAWVINAQYTHHYTSGGVMVREEEAHACAFDACMAWIEAEKYLPYIGID